MSTRSPSDFLAQYRTISNKLKKRFLRKTNASEPSDQFASLAAQCERSHLPQYAGLSWTAVAKCESSLGHLNEEATAMVKAGRLYLQADETYCVRCYEFLREGLNCLNHAQQLYGDSNPLSVCLCLETGECLRARSPHEAVTYLSKACQILKSSPHLLLVAQNHLASAKIAIGDYEGALSLLTDTVSTVNVITRYPHGIYSSILIRCEITRILLILLLRPAPQKISPELTALVEKYTWIGEPDSETIFWLGEELFFLLQSLVVACQCQEMEAVNDLESELFKYFSQEQKELLHAILDQINFSEK